jgi:hypothetical protein
MDMTTVMVIFLIGLVFGMLLMASLLRPRSF